MKSAARSKLRVMDAAGVTGNPESMTTRRPITRWPGVLAARVSSNTTG
ncbi:MAG: hypothetical protein JWP29_3450 [Rhodoferax sp.]|nr:hypothetical protein [Rhodoferax sp.]